MEKRDYEALFLYPTQEDVFKEALEGTKQLFSSYGVDIVSEDDMGVKRLAYEVNKKRDGHYYQFRLKMDGKKLSAMNKEIVLREDILRHLFIKIEQKYYPVSKSK